MKKHTLIFLSLLVLLLSIVGCSNDSEANADVIENELWDIKDMPFSDHVKEVFPEEKYEFTTVDVNGFNIADEYLKYRIAMAPPKMDPKIAFKNFVIRSVVAIRKDDDPYTIYFLTNGKGYTRADFSKETPVLEGINNYEMVEYTPEETLVIVQRKE